MPILLHSEEKQGRFDSHPIVVDPDEGLMLLVIALNRAHFLEHIETLEENEFSSSVSRQSSSLL